MCVGFGAEHHTVANPAELVKNLLGRSRDGIEEGPPRPSNVFKFIVVKAILFLVFQDILGKRRSCFPFGL